MGTNVSKENLKRKTDFSDSPNQSKRFKHPAAPKKDGDENLIPFSWQNGLSSRVSIDREGEMTNKNPNNTDSASVSMIVNMDETEDVDVDIDVEAEHEITANMGKCY